MKKRSSPPSVPLQGRGILAQHPRGFAFVALEGGGPEVFVPPTGRGAALHRDLVEVRYQADARGFTGKVVKVLRRGLIRVGGTVQRQGKEMRLLIGDPRLPASLPLQGKLPRGVQAGSVVVAELVDPPDRPARHPVARVISKLGEPGTAVIEVEKMLLREGIEAAFTGAVQAEVRQLPRRVTAAETKGREDLRKLALLTIDPDDARDHDDAIWVRAHKDGSYRVVVAIADVAHYVPAGSALDTEGADRGCSHYLPDRVIPMLPEEISANLASLVPDRDRLAMVVDVEIGPRGGILRSRFAEAVIRSRARLSYGAVARVLGLAKQKKRDQNAERYRPQLKTLLALSRILRARRIRHGAMFLDTPTTQIILDPRGEPRDILRIASDPTMREAYSMVEEIMLVANEIVATELARHKLATVYRVHEAPLSERIDKLRGYAESLDLPLPRGKKITSRQLAQWLRKADERGLAPLLHQRLLRVMQSARYEVDNVGHYALAKEHYLHFTSPIRRYPDLVVHRLVKLLLRRQRPQGDEAERLEAVARSARVREKAAAVLSREARALYGAVLMRGKVGQAFEGTVTGVNERGIFLVLDAPAVEVQCPVTALPSDRYQVDEDGLQLTGQRGGRRYGVGDHLTVRVTTVSVTAREVQVGLSAGEQEASAEPHEAPKAAAPRKNKKKRARRRRKPAQRGATP